MNIIKNSFFKGAQFNGFFIALTFLTTNLHAYQIPPIPNGYEHLEPILKNYSKDPQYQFFLPEVQSVLIENSDLIRTLQEIEIADDFLPYIADYEGFKGSPIDQNIRVFFYDGSKLPTDSTFRLADGFCILSFEFIFINNRLWSNYLINRIQEMFSLLDQIVEELRQNPSLGVDSLIVLPESLLQNLSNEEIQLYLLSEEGRDRIRELFMREEVTLSDEEISARDHFLRRLILFHELGHCDLKREHEESKLNYE